MILMNMEYPLLCPCSPIDWTRPCLKRCHSEPIKLKQMLKHSKKEQDQNRTNFHLSKFTSISNVKSQMKKLHSKKNAFSDKQRLLFSRLYETTKQRIRLRSKNVNFMKRKFEVSYNCGDGQCVELGVFSEVATVELAYQANPSPIESKSLTSTERNDGAWEGWIQNLKSTALRFSENTSAHGYKRIILAKGGNCHVLTWVLAILTVTMILFAFINDAMKGKELHAFTSSVKSQPAETLPFPTITICNPNPYTDKLLTTRWDRFLETRVAVSSVNETLEDLKLSLQSVQDFNRKMELKLDDFIVSCRWNNDDFNCRDFFVRAVSDIPGCFSFNWNSSRQRYALYAGIPSGLRVRLKLHDRKTEGVKVIAHDPNEFPNVIQKGILVGAGNLAHIGLTRVEYHYLPLPFKAYGTFPCQDISDEVNDYHYLHFTGYTACLANWRLNNTLHRCHCRPEHATGFEDFPYCRLDQLKCVNEALKDAYIKQMKQGKNSSFLCTLPCNKREYSWRMSASHYRKNEVVVKIFYERMSTHIEEQLAMVTWVSVLGNIGGQMGLLTGCSVLTMMEFIELIVLVIFSSWTAFNRQIKQGLQRFRYRLRLFA